MIACINKLNSQSLSSARGIAIGAHTTTTQNIYSLDWNPAGLSTIRDWSVSVSNFSGLSDGNSGVILYSVGAGKKFFSNQAAAIVYSPGKVLKFIVPTTFGIYDSAGNAITTKFNQKITMHQNYSFGYSYSVPDDFSLGLSARYFENNIEDTKYYFDSNYAIQSQIDNYNASLWAFDVGALYSLNPEWTLSIVLKNLFELQEEELIEEMQKYRLRLTKTVQLGAAFKGIDGLTTSVEGDAKKNIRLGGEWFPSEWLQLRSGLYTTNLDKVEAVGLGFGISYAPLQFDVGYLTFLNKSNRGGAVDVNAFTSATFFDIDYTPFTSDRISFSAIVNLGKTDEALARIDYVEMLSEVYTASYQIYAFRPLGKARVRNISTKPIAAKVSFYISDIMNAPTETRSYPIAPSEVLEIPFFAVFSDVISKVKKFSIYDGTVYVNAEVSSDYDDKYQTRVLIRGRNDWDGDVLLLKYFVTPDDPDVMKFTRTVLSQNKPHFDTVAATLQNLEKAKTVFNSFAERLLYIHDPQKSKDFVQYPSETISLNGGDCDDLTVCYASLLMSIGISTTFIDVIPPDQPENSHIYLMFDTGIESKEAALISENQKRYVVRKNNKGMETVWIPVETTAMQKGFNEAWDKGATQYYRDAEINFGIIKGWMRLVDLPIMN